MITVSATLYKLYIIALICVATVRFQINWYIRFSIELSSRFGDIDNLFNNQYELDKGNWATSKLSKSTFKQNDKQITVNILNSRGKPAGPSIVTSLTDTKLDKSGYGKNKNVEEEC